MSSFLFHLGKGNNEENESLKFEKKPSFISMEFDGMDDLLIKKGNKRREELQTKKVNTKVPRQVFTAFLMHCISENKFRKEVFSDMLNYFLDKCLQKEFVKIDNIHGLSIRLGDMEEANFEFDLRLFPIVQELKAKQRITYSSIYTQAIIHYINDKVEKNITEKLRS